MKREEPIAESLSPTGLRELWREAASGARVHDAEVLLIGAPYPERVSGPFGRRVSRAWSHQESGSFGMLPKDGW